MQRLKFESDIFVKISYDAKSPADIADFYLKYSGCTLMLLLIDTEASLDRTEIKIQNP